jgi:Predicted membrane protein (DUF2207) C-terminal domain/Predicted membrane protein (DUF2207) N-terminal domain
MQPSGFPIRGHWRVLLLACALAFTPLLHAKSWRITDFHDTISISQNGSARVNERMTIQFEGEWHGIHRTIPIEYPGPHGTNYTLLLRIISITDGNGSNLKYESHTSNGFRDLKIYIPDAVDATKVVQIEYAAKNGIRYFDSYDEFYWNVTGNDWPVPIDHASALIGFPEGAGGSLRAQAFTGAYGSAGHEATAEVNGAQTTFETTAPLPMRGGLTVDVYIPKGILTEPSALTRLVWFLGSNAIIFLPFATLGVMFMVWHRWGRDPDPGMSVAPMYEPPKNISPAEAGTLIDDTIHPRDITSTLVDLAVRGYVKIEEKDEKGLVFHHKDYVFHLMKPREEWKDLVPHERVMLENIYAGGGTETQLSSLKNHFYTALPLIRTDIMSSLRNKGMYLLDPESAPGYSVGAAVVILIPFALAQFTGYINFFNSIGSLIVAVLISAVIWWLFARQMTAKTLQGGRTRVAILGFQEFMNRVEADRLKRMPPDTFEKFLPYAMALGVEHTWAQKFAGIIQNPPQWYVSPTPYAMGGFNPIFFTSSMHAMSSDMHQVFVSAPRSSSTGSGWSGGGGGGGGFSGGGFGGGGGSAF